MVAVEEPGAAIPQEHRRLKGDSEKALARKNRKFIGGCQVLFETG